MANPEKPISNNKLLLKYAGLTMQIMVGLSLGVFAGIKLDGWMNSKVPLMVWIIPLAIMVAMIWQLIKDTSKK